MISDQSFVLLLFLLTTTIAIEAQPLPENGNTFVIEIIKPFDMPVGDLKTAALNQFSRNDFKTNNFTGDSVDVSKLIYKTIYNGSGRIVDPSTQSSRHSVTGDSIDVTVTYQAVLHPKLPTRKTYNGSTSLKIYFNYTKEIDTESGQTQFQNVTTRVDSSSFVMNYSGSPSAGDKKILDSINNGPSSGKNYTILSLLQSQEFSSALAEEYFTENLANQKLSPTYDSSYLYQFGGFNVTFDMTTAKVESIEGGILHSMKGGIKGFNSNDNREEALMFGDDVAFHTLFTVDFMTNLVAASVGQNKDWKGYKLDRTKFKMPAFGWRLIDLEYILDGFAEKYGQYYLNDIRVVCDPKSLDKLGIDQMSDKMHIEMNWTCKGNLLGVSPNPLLLDFDIQLTYIVTFNTDNNQINVMIDKTYLQSFNFREVDGLKVVDLKLLRHHAKEIVDRFRGYTIGTNFKVKEGSSRVALKENEGLWVG